MEQGCCKKFAKTIKNKKKGGKAKSKETRGGSSHTFV